MACGTERTPATSMSWAFLRKCPADFAACRRQHSGDVLHQDGSRSGNRRDGETARSTARIIIWQKSGNRRNERHGILCR
jgi:hypothetical protein